MNLATLVNPTDRQREFLAKIAKYNYVLYGGAAGGGKSYILRWWLVIYLVWLYQKFGLRNVQVGLFCEDYPSLIDRQISKIQFEFPPELGKLNQGVVKNFKLAEHLGGGVIALRNLDDPSKYLSAEFAAIAVDELSRNPKGIFDFLRLRLRWPGVEEPKFAGGTNPGGMGHAWIKKLWIERNFPAELKPIADQFSFVQAIALDNPHLTSQYWDNLKTLPPELAKMYAYGDWNVFAGQYFSNFSDLKHVYLPGTVTFQPWWKRWISGDWGYAHPTCIHWHAIDEEKRVYTYREFYGAELGETALAAKIVELSKDEKGKPENLSGFFFSPDAAGKKGEAHTVSEQLGHILSQAGLPKPSRADDGRVAGWRLMYELLESGHWMISRDCVNLIKCLPTLIRDEDNLEDVLKVDHTDNEIGDDAADSARYGLKTMLAPRAVPYVEQLTRELVKYEDPTQRAMAALRFTHKRRERRAGWKIH